MWKIRDLLSKLQTKLWHLNCQLAHDNQVFIRLPFPKIVCPRKVRLHKDRVPTATDIMFENNKSHSSPFKRWAPLGLTLVYWVRLFCLFFQKSHMTDLQISKITRFKHVRRKTLQKRSKSTIGNNNNNNIRTKMINEARSWGTRIINPVQK